MTDVAKNLELIRTRMQDCAQRCGRPTDSVSLLAVSKKQPATAIRQAFNAGQRDFGENYLQEALGKMADLEDLPINWWYIGPIQSNKTRGIAENFDWVLSVPGAKIARRLSDQRPGQCGPLNVCIQVNLSGEETKSGTSLAALPGLCAELASLPGLVLRGLMAIPAPEADPNKQRAVFQQLSDAMASLRQAYPSMDTLSM